MKHWSLSLGVMLEAIVGDPAAFERYAAWQAHERRFARMRRGRERHADMTTGKHAGRARRS